jgi:hypothetical protein
VNGRRLGNFQVDQFVLLLTWWWHGRDKQGPSTAATLPVMPVDRNGPHCRTLRNAEFLLSRLLAFVGYDAIPDSSHSIEAGKQLGTDKSGQSFE